MSHDDDRDAPDPRRSTSGFPVWLLLLLVGGFLGLLLVVAVGVAGFFFMARSAERDVEMQMDMEEQRAIGEQETVVAQNRAVATSRTYTREDFKSLVDDKTEQEVEDALGKPARIEQNGPTAQWHYEKRTIDRTTGTTDPSVRVTFEFGRVTAITY